MKRFILSGLTVVLAVGLTLGALAFIAPHANAARRTAAIPSVDYSAPGPSVGVDRQDNQFVFWKGSTNTKLWEAVYTAGSGWSSGAIDLGNVGSNLASEPSVAVANFGGFLTSPSGNVRDGAQFVAWNNGSGNLFWAYWAGSVSSRGSGWVSKGSVPGVSNASGTPSVAFNNHSDEWGPGGSEISIWYEGNDSHLYFVRIADPLGGTNGIGGSLHYYGPFQATFNGQSLGQLGSNPGASDSAPAGYGPFVDSPGEGQVEWNGATNNSLYYVQYQVDFSSGGITITSPSIKIDGWDGLGHPDTTVEYLPAQTLSAAPVVVFDSAWEDVNNHGLDFGFNSPGEFLASQNLPLTLGNLGSAPSIGYWPGANANPNSTNPHYYIFFTGQDGLLHEEFYNGSTWKDYKFSQFGQLG
jgi:hypothetical protein